MKLSVKSRYALEAMLTIALLARDGNVPVPVRDVARQRGISERFLAQILSALRRAGLLESVRGAQGGFFLARTPDQIVAGDVVRAVEGSLAPVDCVDVADDADTACHLRGQCTTFGLWREVTERINQTLDRASLADLLRCASGAERGEAAL